MAKKREQEIRTLATREFRVSTAEDGTRTLSGVIPYNSLSVDLGGFTELLAPGVFAGALQPDADILCLRDHKAELLMGRTKSSTLALSDSPEGLQFACKLPKTTQAADLAESVDRGDLDATSFGFYTLDDNWVADASGNVVRTLISAELFEISPCSFAAYQGSTVTVRSCPAELRSLLTRPEHRANPNGTGCECDCPECQANNCADCSNADCADDRCDGHERGKPITNSELETLQLQLHLASLL